MRVDEAPVPKPCQASLEAMRERPQWRRFCEGCQKDVHMLSAMTERMARQFLERPENRHVCIRYEHDADGNILFAPERSRTRVRLPVTVGLAAALATCAPGCAKQHDSDQAQAAALASASASALASAAVASAHAARLAEAQQRVDTLGIRLTQAKEQAELDQLKAQLLQAQKVLLEVQREVGPQRGLPRMGCFCPPSDPSCSSCL